MAEMHETADLEKLFADFRNRDWDEALRDASAIYRRECMVICKGLLDPDSDLAPFHRAIKQLALSQYCRMIRETGREAESPEAMSHEELLAELEAIDHQYVAKVYDLINFHPLLYKMSGHDRLQSVVDALINGRANEEIIVNGFQLRMDLPKNTSELLAWHRDADYFPGFPPDGLVSWIPLHEITPDYGGISVIPGVLKLDEFRTYEWDKRRSGTNRVTKRYELRGEKALDTEYKKVRVETEPGDAVLFSMRSPHKSEYNHSEKIRWCIQIRWYPANDPVYYNQTRGEMSQ